MPLPSEIQIVPLDFDRIRTDLKRYLQSQPLLQDYNYEGSALSTLIDLLAYDAYYHGWYTNFAVNEVFLQTAQIRNSVVAAARQVGYIPRSISSAVATVDVVLTNIDTTEATIEMPRYVKFTSNAGGNIVTFYTTDARTQETFAESTVTFSEVELYEGVNLTQTFTIGSGDLQSAGVRLTIPNQNVDTRTITVSVKPQANSVTTFVYERANAITPVRPTSNVYFLFENNEGSYDIQFGDGYVGRNLTAGQQVTIDYLISSGVQGNGANTFTFADTLSRLVVNTTGVIVAATLSNANVPASGGAAQESIESIKKNAPAVYQAQGRIVTPEDARTVLLTEYNGIESLSVWGGEDNDPPTYGKMFLALKPFNADKFASIQKTTIINKILRPKSLPILSFEIVDPDYLYIILDVEAKYTPSLTTKNTSELADIIVDALVNYAQVSLGQFGSVFRYSQISRLIDTAESSIQSNVTGVKLEKRFQSVPTTGSYVLEFANPIFTSSNTNNLVTVTSKIGIQRFSHIDQLGLVRTDCFVENDTSTLNVYREDPVEGRLIVYPSVGTVNFDTGTVTFTNFYPQNVTTNYRGDMRIQAIPYTSDIIARRSQIVRVLEESINIRVVPDLLDRRGTTSGRIVNGSIVF